MAAEISGNSSPTYLYNGDHSRRYHGAMNPDVSPAFISRRWHGLHRKALALVLSVSLGIGPALAEGLPDLGDISQGVISPQIERSIGQQIFSEIRQREPDFVDDPEINGYLNRLGARLGSHVEGGLSDVTGARGFELFALRDSTLNAFALPGGYIGVHTGLILATQSESELASVLAHEISHVTQHHIARGVSSQGVGQIATMLSIAIALLAVRSNPDVAMGAAMAGQAVGIQNQLNYSRDFEREADRLGLQLLSRADFDIRGMPSFFDRMQKYGAFYEGKNAAPSYLRSHPLTTERIAAVTDRIEGQPYRQVSDSLEFLLVKARLRSQNGYVPDIVTDFQTQLESATPVGQVVVHYGLARTYLRDNNMTAALREQGLMERGAKANKLTSPMFDTLAAEMLLNQNEPAAAAKVLARSRTHYPQDRAINYLLIDAYLRAGQAAAALEATRDDLVSFPEDGRMYGLQAKSYAALGQRLEQHRAQAEAYVLLGQLPLAVHQLELAQTAGDGDFYAQSQVDARLRELKIRHLEMMKAMKK